MSYKKEKTIGEVVMYVEVENGGHDDMDFVKDI